MVSLSPIIPGLHHVWRKLGTQHRSGDHHHPGQLSSSIILIVKSSLQLGRAAKDIGTTLESSLQNVAENLEGAFITIGEGTAERAGSVYIFLASKC